MRQNNRRGDASAEGRIERAFARNARPRGARERPAPGGRADSLRGQRHHDPYAPVTTPPCRSSRCQLSHTTSITAMPHASTSDASPGIERYESVTTSIAAAGSTAEAPAPLRCGSRRSRDTTDRPMAQGRRVADAGFSAGTQGPSCRALLRRRAWVTACSAARIPQTRWSSQASARRARCARPPCASKGENK